MLCIRINLTPEIRIEQAILNVGVDLPEYVTKLTVIGTITNDDCGFISRNMRETLQELDLSEASFEGNEIPDCAFWGCIGLTTVIIPDSVVKIGNYAFSFCTALVSVNIPDSVANIGCEAFSGCTNLAYIAIPASVTVIGNGIVHPMSSFKNCPARITVHPENHVYKIENGRLRNKVPVNIKVKLTPETGLEQALKQRKINNPQLLKKLTISGRFTQSDFDYIRANMSENLQVLEIREIPFDKKAIPDISFKDFLKLERVNMYKVIVNIDGLRDGGSEISTTIIFV